MIKLIILIGSVLIFLWGTRWLKARLLQQVQDRHPARNSQGMSIADAEAILGLATSYSKADIVKAHRHLIQGVHPDRGGSTYLAQQLNQAKALLLERVQD